MKTNKRQKYLKAIDREYPKLEELLWAVNGMKMDKVFLNEVKRDKDGNLVECFTKKGGKLYERLCSIIYGAIVLTEVPNGDEVFEHIQSTLDEIASDD